MKVRFYVDSGANIHSGRDEVIDLGDEFGVDDESWRAMSDKEKSEMVEEWAVGSGLEWGWEEIK